MTITIVSALLDGGTIWLRARIISEKCLDWVVDSFFTSVKNDKVRMDVAREGAKVGERWKMSLVTVAIDVRETTNRFLQRRCGKNVVPISWFYEKLNDL